MKITQTTILADQDLPGEKPFSYRALVVDDNVAFAKTMMWTMEMMGHTAQIAHEGRNAIALAKSFHPDVIFLDIGIPGMNGYEICRAMRKEPELENTLIVAQTGWGKKEHREHSKKAGFDYHLVKPVDIKALQSIFSVLDKKKLHG